MSVVGIDMGNDTSVVAVAHRRVIDVVQNSASNRKTASMVAFTDADRVIGDDAAAQVPANFRNTAMNAKRMLGIAYGSEDMREEQTYQYLPDMLVPSPAGNGGVGFRVRYCGEETVLSAEQVVATLMDRLKRTAETGLGSAVKDCVVAVPSFWGERQRRALLDACRLADLNVLRLMNESTAVALQYGILRPLAADEQRHVLFVDVGHSATTAALATFKQGSLTVRATAADRHFGARTFDRALVRHLAAEIQEKYKMDVLSNPKALMKLFKEAANVKKTLSANAFTPYNIEYIMNDRDVSGTITREQFESLMAPLMERLVAPLNRAMAAAGVSKSDLYAVEVVGGGVRIPMVHRALCEWLGRDVSRTCDGDESVARGCALQCAMLSATFKVREFETHDITPYAVDLSWGAPSRDPASRDVSDAAESSTRVFEAGSSFPVVKLVSFKERDEPFQIEAVYAPGQDVPGGWGPLIGRYHIGGVDADAQKIKVKVKVDVHGCVVVSSASAVKETDAPEEPAAAPAQADGASSPAAPAAGGDAAPASGGDAPAAAPSSSSSAEQGPAPMETEPAGGDAAAASASGDGSGKKKRLIKVNLPVTVNAHGGMGEAEFKNTFERESRMVAHDRLVFETNERRNDLEQYVLEMGSAVEDGGELSEFVNSKDREQLQAVLAAEQEWLEGEGTEAAKSVFVSRLAEVRKLGDPIRKRRVEFEQRPERINHLKGTIVRYELEAASKEEQFAHISDEDRALVAARAKDADDWLQGVLQRQQALPNSANPAVWVADLTAKAAELSAFCSAIMNKPKPKAPTPAPSPPPAGAAGAGASEAGPAPMDTDAGAAPAAGSGDEAAPEAAAADADAAKSGSGMDVDA